MDILVWLPFIIFHVITFIVAFSICLKSKINWLWSLFGLLGVIGLFVVSIVSSAKHSHTNDSNENMKIKINNLSFKSNEIKRKWKCPSCESINEEGVKFCPNCGRPYSEDYLLEDWICPKCGTKNVHNSYHCSNCDHERDV